MADQSKESAVNIIQYLGNVTTAVDKNNNSIQEIGATAEELMNSIKLESVSDVIVRENPCKLCKTIYFIPKSQKYN